MMAYLGEKKLANFRDRGAKDAHRNSEKFKERPGMSEAHLALIRQLPCCACRQTAPCQVHHLKANTGERGAGLRSTDKWGVPLCLHCHDSVERIGTRNEPQWFKDRELDGNLLAVDLWTNTGDLERMKRILAAHWELGT